METSKRTEGLKPPVLLRSAETARAPTGVGPRFHYNTFSRKSQLKICKQNVNVLNPETKGAESPKKEVHSEASPKPAASSQPSRAEFTQTKSIAIFQTHSAAHFEFYQSPINSPGPLSISEYSDFTILKKTYFKNVGKIRSHSAQTASLFLPLNF